MECVVESLWVQEEEDLVVAVEEVDRVGLVNFDPLACYQCGVHGHLDSDCPQTGAQSQ